MNSSFFSVVGKIWRALVLAGLMAVGARAAGPLTVENGVLLRDGAPCHAIGVNYYDGFLRMIDPEAGPEERESWRAGLATLAERGVPFVRFSASGFFPNDQKLYRENPDEHFARLDAFVAEAERLGVGLVPSLFWSFFSVPDIVGEPLSAWGREESATRAWMRRYTTEVVTRYRDSRAIWAWEFGNEYIKRADLPKVSDRSTIAPRRGTPKERGEADRLSSAQIRSAYVEFARLVRELDPRRPISAGDALPRGTAWHLRKGKGWGVDSAEQFAEVLVEDAPAPMDLISVHAYHRDGTGKGAAHRGLEGLPTKETLRVAMEAARGAGKVLFVGEFGSNKASPEVRRVVETRELFEALVELRVQLAAVWVFDCLSPATAHHNIRADNEHAYILDLVAEANRRLAAGETATKAGADATTLTAMERE